MQSQLENYIKPGIVHFMAYPVLLGHGPILESLKKIIQDDYFKVIEFSWIKDPEVRKEAKQMLETSAIEMKYGAQPRLLSQKLNLNSEDEVHRLKAVREIRDAIDDARYFGISDVGILSGAYPGPEKQAIAMDLLEKSLLDICSYASEKSVNIVMEVFDQAIDKKCLIGKAEDAREIASRISAKHSNFGLLVDLSHIPLLGESPSQALQPVKEFVRHIHIGNCYMDLKSDQAYGDHHPRFGYPGAANDVDQIVDFLKELFNIGYLKRNGLTPMPISFEVKPVSGEDPELVIANSKRKLAEAWRKLVI